MAVTFVSRAVSATSATFSVWGRDECPFGGEHSLRSSSLRRSVVPLKPPSFHRDGVGSLFKTTIVSPRPWFFAGLPPLPRPLEVSAFCSESECCLRSTACLEVTSGTCSAGHYFNEPCVSGSGRNLSPYLRQSTAALGRISHIFLHDGGHGS